MNTILNKSSNAEFAELFVKRIPYVYERIDIMADYYKTKSIKSSEQLSIRRGQSENIHIVSFLSKVSSNFHNSILRNSDTKTSDFLKFLELFGSSEIILSSENRCILVNATEQHELLHL